MNSSSTPSRHACIGLSAVLVIILLWAVSQGQGHGSSSDSSSSPVQVSLSITPADAESTKIGSSAATQHEDDAQSSHGDSSSLDKKSTTIQWWAADPPGVDLAHSKSMWAHEVSPKISASRSEFAQKHPQLVFIKGLKVGGTSVAVALDNAARKYGIKLQDSISANAARTGAVSNHPKCEKKALWFHHVQKAPWMPVCIPFARLVTLLREPISQTLSWETMSINRRYFIHYPSHPCPGHHHFPIPGISLQDMLSRVDHCVDTQFRQNVTAHLVARQVESWATGFPGMAVSMTARWIAGTNVYRHITAADLIKLLDEEYFLVGVTERLNEFLVLLALHMGWDPKDLYYKRCKTQNVDVGNAAFTSLFPEMHAKLEGSCGMMSEVYQHVRTQFDRHVAQLGPWFPKMVSEFEAGLKAYQKHHSSSDGSLTWRVHTYLDGEYEFC